MDLSKIVDLQTLKAMAYDAIAAKERIESDLSKINLRIGQLAEGISSLPTPPEPVDPNKATPAVPAQDGDVAPNTPSATEAPNA